MESVDGKDMMKKRVFISFDYDNDLELKSMFIGQARNTNSPFEIVDLSIKEAIDSNWKANARRRIKGCDVVLVICGRHTHTAKGVSAEIKIAQEEGIPYFLLKGYNTGVCRKPTESKSTDKIHPWTWDNLEILINGKKKRSRMQKPINPPQKQTRSAPPKTAKSASSQKSTNKKPIQSKKKSENMWNDFITLLWGK